jgi:nucleoside-diphosphate-sugar epimerase
MANALSIAVTGSTGLIGSAFLDKIPEKVLLERRIHLNTLAVSAIPNVVQSLSSEGVDVLLHLGWPASTFKENYRFAESNFDALQKTIVLKEACLENNILFVGIGSVVDSFCGDGNFYQLTKFACRQMLSSEIRDEIITWVRPFYVFNNDSWPTFLHGDVNLPILIQDNNDRDFIHIDDVVTGLWAIIQHRIRGEIDLGSGILRKPSDICAVFGKEFQVRSDFVEKTVSSQYAPAKPNLQLSKYWNPKQTIDIFKERK